ncbi:sugar ABC transporter permease [Vallitalea longa]|uniref:Sugar ABC transporter permease n=1 Tax=Vallitalea longa TaxID=2936439 RepID=A0A9W5YCE4_9FIRM|nr:ABC transporter permease subunit [Vallitalea longa]GKX29364.1 sugar ABC transporter permease [Vallitalea longa]
MDANIVTDTKYKNIDRKKRSKNLKYIKKTWMLYVFVLPAILYLLILHYFPMYGIQIAFKDYRVTQGIIGSEWVGFQHFAEFFGSYQFWQLLKNTLILSFYGLIAGFPMPIILAILLYYTVNKKLKKVTQMVTYMPHFISTVVFCGMIFILLGHDGIYNQILHNLGFKGIEFMTKGENFRHIYVWSGVLKGMGWSSIIYIAALTGVDPQIHEAAIVDGASKFQRIKYIDLPTILPTIMILLILNLGRIMGVGFEKAYLLQNNINIEYSEIISTYVYKVGMQGGQFSYSTAIGLFNNIINFILLITVNRVSKKLSNISLF